MCLLRPRRIGSVRRKRRNKIPRSRDVRQEEGREREINTGSKTRKSAKSIINQKSLIFNYPREPEQKVPQWDVARRPDDIAHSFRYSFIFDVGATLALHFVRFSFIFFPFAASASLAVRALREKNANVEDESAVLLT